MKKFIGIHPIQLSERKLQGAKITFIWKSCVPLQISKHASWRPHSKRQVSATTTTKSEEKERNIGTIFHPLQIKLNKKHRLLTFYSHKTGKKKKKNTLWAGPAGATWRFPPETDPNYLSLFFLHKLRKINK